VLSGVCRRRNCTGGNRAIGASVAPIELGRASRTFQLAATAVVAGVCGDPRWRCIVRGNEGTHANDRDQTVSTAKGRTEAPEDEVPPDLLRTVDALIESRPDLADPIQLRRFNEALSKRVATIRAPNTRTDQTEICWARRMTSIATAFSGGVTAALIAAVAAPGAVSRLRDTP
jgi:hypothetical protein